MRSAATKNIISFFSLPFAIAAGSFLFYEKHGKMVVDVSKATKVSKEVIICDSHPLKPLWPLSPLKPSG